jgi:hypothetical protein
VDVSGCGYTVDELQQQLFDRFNIQIEKSTFNTITLLLTIGTTRSKVSRLYDALMRLAREGRAQRRLVRTPEIPALTRLRYCRATPITAAASWCRCSTKRSASIARLRTGSAPTASCPTRPAFRCWCRAS